MKLCSLPSCENMFEPAAVRQLYCSNPHLFHCSDCDEPFPSAPKDIKRRGLLCPSCRNAKHSEARLAAIAEKLIPCRFFNCENSFNPSGPRSFYCSKPHEVSCDDCAATITVKPSNRVSFTCLLCSSKARIVKTKATNLERYGFENVLQVEAVKEKVKATVRARYGVDFALQAEEVKAKIRETSLRLYGTENPTASSVVQEKTSKTNLERYGVPCVLQAEDIREKIKATNLEKYGEPFPLMNEEVKTKARDTSLAKYGTDFPAQSDEVKARIAATNLERLGYSSSLSSPIVREKIRATNLSRLDFEHPTQSSAVRAKIRETNLKRYGFENVFQVPEFQEKSKATYFENLKDGTHVGSRKVSQINLRFAEYLKTEFNLTLSDVELEFPMGGAQFDIRVRKTLIELNPTVSHNSARSFHCITRGCPRGCIEHKAIAQGYHHGRAKLAQENGYSLVQIYDWDSTENISRLLAGKLEAGWSHHSARRLHGFKISTKAANSFLAQEHIQGGTRGQSHCYGLHDEDGQLLAVATFGTSRFKSKFQWEFLRFAVKRGNIIHGAPNYLWRMFLEDASPTSVISYVDFNHSTAPVLFLAGLGFQEVKNTGPALVWSKKNLKIYNNSLIRQGADRLIGTEYGPRGECGLGNKEIMLIEGWLPVHTAGNRVFHWLPSDS